jgi:hypothetical protein
MEPIAFALIGGGWRAGFFERVAGALPDRFRLTGRYSIRAPAGDASLDELLAAEPAFVVLAVPRDATPVLLTELAERGVAVLAETPPAPDVDGLRALARLSKFGSRIQVAEQSITARRFDSPIVAGPDREGPPSSERVISVEQVIATFDFGDRLGILDFTDEQYFSWIRGLRMLIRGERGEIDGHVVRWLADAGTPVHLMLERHDAGHDGNLEGLYLEGITAGAEWVYRNPFAPARLTDDEIAVATCLARMSEAIDGGPDVCSLADAVQDRYLDLLVAQSVASGLPVRAAGHLWDAG